MPTSARLLRIGRLGLAPIGLRADRALSAFGHRRRVGHRFGAEHEDRDRKGDSDEAGPDQVGEVEAGVERRRNLGGRLLQHSYTA